MLTILWEDRLGEPKIKNYGPHVLALQCIADRLHDAWGGRRYDEFVTSNPRKSDNRLLQALDDTKLSGPDPTIAVLDLDQIHRPLELPAASCKRDIIAKVRDRAPGTIVVLLEKNIETLVDECREILKLPVTGGKPTPMERDQVLHAMAAAEPEKRDKLLERMPSFERLVKRILGHIVTPAVHVS